MAAAARRNGLLRALIWSAGGRALLVVMVLAAAAASRMGPERHAYASGTWWLDRFAYWDSYHVTRIATEGYFAPGRSCCDQAWFPGYPLLTRAVSPLTGDVAIAAGLAISWVAAAGSGALLWGLVRDSSRSTRVSNRALMLLLTAPFGVFFVAVYTESLWLALALIGWWCGSRRRWWGAGLAVPAATTVRVNGLFVAAALVVMYLEQLRADGRGTRPRFDALGLTLPAVPAIGFAMWLHERTGSWTAWHDAEVAGWHRVPTWPWRALSNQVAAISEGTPLLAFTRALDLVVILAGAALIAVAWRLRRWPEMALLALSVGAVATSPNYDSAGRYALSWFPAFWLVAELGEHHRLRWLPRTVIAASVLILLAVITLFAQRHWVG
jgi:hypothetical protein